MGAPGWISGSASRDAAFFLLPGALAFAAAAAVGEGTSATLVFLFVANALLDAGHVYVTFLRTHLNTAERRSRAIYWLWPAGTFAALFLWYYLRLPYYWSFVVYFTIYHQLRQFYGITRWYERLHGRVCRASHFFVYALPLAPFVLYHFRPDARAGYYAENELFLARGLQSWFPTLVVLYFGLVAVWVGFEAWLWLREKRREPGRVLSLAGAAVTYGLAFLVGKTEAEILGPLQVSHGIAYFALMSLSLTRVQPRFYSSLGKAWAIVVVTAFLFGGLEGGFAEAFLDIDPRYATSPASWPMALVLAGLLTPQIVHFLFDAVIWRAQHREAGLVYGSRATPIERARAA